MNTLDTEHLRSWIGRQETASDVITQALADRVLSTLTIAKRVEGQTPIGTQWCIAPPAVDLDLLGLDGHPAKGGFLPPVPYDLRMWAGGTLQFHAPLWVNDVVTRQSTITEITQKSGKSGPLCFVTVRHEYLVGDDLRITEHQDIVYRNPVPKAKKTAPKKLTLPTADTLIWTNPTPTLLFRFSAMTFNGHRIHYDHPYATKTEGYGGLVVHGPMQAILMATLAEKVSDKPIKRITYRGLATLDNTAPFATGVQKMADRSIECWCGRDDTGVTMTATAWT